MDVQRSLSKSAGPSAAHETVTVRPFLLKPQCMNGLFESTRVGRVDLFDMQGRRVRTEFQGFAKGITERTFRTDGLAPGLYLVSARQGSSKTVRRVTVLR